MDFTMLALLGFVAMVVLMVAFIAERGKKEEDLRPQGNVVVEMFWENVDTDIDLWVRGPDSIAVGFSNKGGPLFNLLRDDLGHINDSSGINQEVSFSRWIEPGEYVVNVHWYLLKGSIPPIKVRVLVRVRGKSPNDSMVEVISSEVELRYEKHEVTVARFELDKDGKLVPGTLNRIPTSLFPEQTGVGGPH